MSTSLPPERPWLPLAGIFLSLAALLTIPFLLDRISSDIDRRLAETVLPASHAVHELRLALAEEMLLHEHRDDLDAGDPQLAEAAGRRRDAWSRLEGGSTRLDPARREAIGRLGALVASWEGLAGGAGAGAAFDAAMDELNALDRSLEVLTAEHRAKIESLGRLGTGATATLSILAFFSAVVVVRLEHRVRAAALETQRAHRQQKVLLESSGEGVFGIDAEGTCTFVNPAASALLGHEPQDVVGRNLHALIHHSRADGTPHPLTDCPSWRALKLGVMSESTDEVLWRKDGTSIRGEYIAAPIVEHGEVRGAVITVRDVTARLEAEQERVELLERAHEARALAEEAEQRAKFLADASEIFASTLEVEKTLESLALLVVPRIADSCIIYLVDESGEIQRMHPTHADPDRQRILEEQLEKYPPRLQSLIPPVRRALQLGHSSLLQDISEGDLKARPGDATHTSVGALLGVQTLVVAPLRARGRTIGALSFARADASRDYGPEDLTLAEELAGRAALAIDNARLYQQAQGAAAVRNELTAIVSHDLRNPLNVVRMGTQSLLRHWPPTGDGSQERQQLAVMRKAAERMNRLIQDLLDLAQIDAGRLRIDASWTDPIELLRDTQELLQPLARERDVSIVIEEGADLPLAWGDGERLLQVLSNLGSNAVKFSAPGTTVRLAARHAADRVTFSVEDAGPGIPPEHLPHIFDRFWQAKQRRNGGVGLGLSIVRGIVEGHGGKLWVESAEGAGSTFQFSIPTGAALLTESEMPRRGAAANA